MKTTDPYLYPDRDVLINKRNIKDANQLDALESDIIPLRIIALRKESIEINSVFDIQKIHKYLFDPIFDWAGEFRTITMYKREPILDGYSVDYTPHDYIKKEMTDLDKRFHSLKWDNMSLEDKVSNASSIIQALWQIHCFREGNTRTVALFLYFLLKKIGLHINSEFLGKNAKYFRNSLVLASLYSASKPEFLKGIIGDAVTYKNVQTNKYEMLNGYKVEKYSYSNHTVDKVKTIKNIMKE